MREIEFIANNPGDWMLHCHMFHHVMNFMSSMVGPMGGHTVQGMRAGQSPPRPAWGSPTAGRRSRTPTARAWGGAMGEQTSLERAVGTGPRAIGSAMAGEHARDGDADGRAWRTATAAAGAGCPAIRRG